MSGKRGSSSARSSPAVRSASKAKSPYSPKSPRENAESDRNMAIETSDSDADANDDDIDTYWLAGIISVDLVLVDIYKVLN